VVLSMSISMLSYCVPLLVSDSCGIVFCPSLADPLFQIRRSLSPNILLTCLSTIRTRLSKTSTFPSYPQSVTRAQTKITKHWMQKSQRPFVRTGGTTKNLTCPRCFLICRTLTRASSLSHQRKPKTCFRANRS
jgi:hypothetical protein